MSMGGQLRPEMALAHFSTIAAATDLPLICFNYTLAGGLGYPHETLAEARRGGADDPRDQGLVRRPGVARAQHPRAAIAAAAGHGAVDPQRLAA